MFFCILVLTWHNIGGYKSYQTCFSCLSVLWIYRIPVLIQRLFAVSIFQRLILLAVDASIHVEKNLSIRPDISLGKRSCVSGLWLGQQRLAELQ